MFIKFNIYREGLRRAFKLVKKQPVPKEEKYRRVNQIGGKRQAEVFNQRVEQRVSLLRCVV